MKTIILGLDPEKIPAQQVAHLWELVPEEQVLISAARAEMEPILPQLEVAAAGVPLDLVLSAPNLRWFQQWGAGADWLLRYPQALERDFILTNVSGIHAIPISEHILAMMLAFARRLPESVRAQARGDWLKRSHFEVAELAGKTLLVAGLGSIGQRVAHLALAFGMQVGGVRRDPSAAVEGVEPIVPPDQLNQLLPSADFVVLTAPLTAATMGMIGAKELALMKPTAYLINIGRGKMIDEGALVDALRAGGIAGAGLDVFETEPLPPESPLWAMENVIITAHYSGSTPHYHERAMAIFLENLRRYLAGEMLQNVVDKQLGY